MAPTRTVVRINCRLVDEAARVLGAKSRTEAVHIALRDCGAPKLQEADEKFAGHD
jgi:Arc/MetJ family transcription regulator